MGVKDAYDNGSTFISFFLVVAMYAADLSMGFNGLAFQGVFIGFSSWIQSFWRTLVSVTVAIFTVVYFMGLRGASKEDAIVYAMFSFITAFVFVYAGGIVILHLVLLFLSITFLYGKNTNLADRLKILSFLYVADFILLSLLTGFRAFIHLESLRYIVPISVLFVIFQASQIESDKFLRTLYRIVFVLIILIYAFGFLDSVYILGQYQTISRQQVAQDLKTLWESARGNIGDLYKRTIQTIQQPFNQTQYQGNQEETEDPQGVYLTHLNLGERTFFPDDTVHIWAKLEAHTIETPFSVKVSCQTEIETDTELIIVEGIVDEITKDTYTELDIISGVERSIPCIFSDLPEGKYEAKFIAEFDFGSDTRKKFYMMDRDRLIDDLTLIDQNGKDASPVAVLRDLYDIKETDPKSLASSGPVKVSIESDKSPWDLGKTNNIRPFVGLTIKNEWEKGGYIKKVNDVYIKIPDDFSISSTIDSCDEPVTQTNELSELGYIVYKISEPLDFEIYDFFSINCRMDINNARLDPIAVTTRFLKSHVDYSYIIEEKIDFEVEGLDLLEEVQELEIKNSICCKITQKGTGDIDYEYKGDNELCTNYASENPEVATSSIVESDRGYCVGGWCCQTELNTGFAYSWVTDKGKCTTQSTQAREILDFEYNYKCGK
jgi:hypothetical protein